MMVELSILFQFRKIEWSFDVSGSVSQKIDCNKDLHLQVRDKRARLCIFYIPDTDDKSFSKK